MSVYLLGSSNDDTDGGDLGLGEGLKPGGIPVYPTRIIADVWCRLSTSPDKVIKSDTIDHKHNLSTDIHNKHSDLANGGTSTKIIIPKNKNVHRKSKLSSSADDQEEFPTYAEIQYGTSLRQQKKLFEQSLDAIVARHKATNPGSPCPFQVQDGCNGVVIGCHPLHPEEAERKLVIVLQEVEDLKMELETCHRRLDAKYRAISILRSQAEESTTHQNRFTKLSKEQTTKLAKDVGGGTRNPYISDSVLPPHKTPKTDALKNIGSPFLVHAYYGGGEFMPGTFSHNIGVCLDNASLSATLDSKNQELRKVGAQKMALARERDELLALLDVTERLKYERSQSRSSDDEAYTEFTSAELAVLGACNCRRPNGTPCGCAYAAAKMRREILHLREKNDLLSQRREEALLTVEAYRGAFEEQLQRNKTLMSQLAQLASMTTSRGKKAKAVLQFLLETFNEENSFESVTSGESSSSDVSPSHTIDVNALREQAGGDKELVGLLLEAFQANTDAIAHHKLAARILAKKVQDMEQKVDANVEVVFTEP